MPDVFTRSKRSAVMAGIRSRGNRDTELRLAALLRANRIAGWRRHVVIPLGSSSRREEARTSAREAATTDKVRASSRRLLQMRVRPDFVFRKERVVVFVDGCFWHGCPRCYVRPRQNRKFWDAKREQNRARDRRQARALKAAGWRVVRLWEHELAGKHEARVMVKLRRAISARKTRRG